MGKLYKTLLETQVLINGKSLREAEEEKDEKETKEEKAEEKDEKEEEAEEKEETEDPGEEPEDAKGNLEQKGRISDSMCEILNTQIKNELQSSQIYKGMSCWLDDKGWIGASKYFFKASSEELAHMDKTYQYLFDRNMVAKVPVCEAVKQEFKDIREVVEASLQHEIDVTKNWEDISNKAKEEGDNTTYEFAQFFLKEQVEEEEKFRKILFKMDLDMPKWELDELFEDLLA
jgi:ferritin